jgi:hypothetical protein
MATPKPLPKPASPSRRHSKRNVVPGKSAQTNGLELRSYDVGALPSPTLPNERVAELLPDRWSPSNASDSVSTAVGTDGDDSDDRSKRTETNAKASGKPFLLED